MRFPPSAEAIAGAIQATLDTAVGPDGIPFSAWKAILATSADILFQCNAWLMAGMLLGAGLNAQYSVFIPKELLDCVPRPKDTRPLGLKNSDIKILASANCRAFRDVSKAKVVELQRGFTHQRNFCLNICELDLVSRVQAMENIFSNEAILAFFDFAEAFPSLAHKWIVLVFTFLGFPSGFLQFLEALLYFNVAYFRGGGRVTFLYIFFSGIIQGCPSSGLVFSVASHPFLTHLKTVQDKINRAQASAACFRACADDLGGALSSYKFLPLVVPVFQAAFNFAGLALKASKCIIVPTANQDLEQAAISIKAWLRVHIPAWSEFSVKGASRYLGVFLGPKSASLNWSAAGKKFLSRASAVAACQFSPNFSTFAYNVYAVSVLGYLSQFGWVPKDVLRLELRAHAKVFHAPMYVFGRTGPFELGDAGLRVCRSVLCTNLAAMFRMARVTLPTTRELFVLLGKKVVVVVP